MRTNKILNAVEFGRETAGKKIISGGTLAGRDVLVIQDHDSFESWYEIWEVGVVCSDDPTRRFSNVPPTPEGLVEVAFVLVEITSTLPQDFIPAGRNE